MLIIAGSSGEGTEAAGELVTAALQPCHLVQGASRQSLQVLLHLEIMAGSPQYGENGGLPCIGFRGLGA